MPAATRRSRGGDPPEHPSPPASSTLLPTRHGPGRSREDQPSSSDTESESEQHSAGAPSFQSIMAVPIPHNIDVVLDTMRRNMELNFRTLHEAIQTQRTEMEKRFDDQRTETDKRFDEVNYQIVELRAHTDKRFEYSDQAAKAQRANRAATHISSRIHPVGRWNAETEQIFFPNRFPARVHKFLRLKRQRNWNVLVSLLRFYDIQSWPTWGVESMWSDDESDAEELLAPPHSTLEEAVEYAPRIALVELAAVIGLDYDKIIANRDDDERAQEDRVTVRKRGLGEATRAAKREKTDREPEQQGGAPGITQRLSMTGRPAPDSVSSDAALGWDTRKTEERTPPERRPRVRDIPAYNQRTTSPLVARAPGDQVSSRKSP